MQDDFDETDGPAEDSTPDPPAPDATAPDLTADEAALLREMPSLADVGPSRRQFLGQTVAGGLGMFALDLLALERTLGAMPPSPAAVYATQPAGNAVRVAFRVNGAARTLDLDPRVVLLDALRERLALTGTKKGCDQGQCGACTVLVDGRRVLSCLTLAATLEGKEVTTIEGLADGDRLHPMQAAFIRHDGFQCGYCTPGQICSAVGLLAEARRGEVSHVSESVGDAGAGPVLLSDDEIRERMSGNLCRCGAYPGIVAAIQEVHSGRQASRTWRFADERQLADARREAPDAAV